MIKFAILSHKVYKVCLKKADIIYSSRCGERMPY